MKEGSRDEIYQHVLLLLKLGGFLGRLLSAHARPRRLSQAHFPHHHSTTLPLPHSCIMEGKEALGGGGGAGGRGPRRGLEGQAGGALK